MITALAIATILLSGASPLEDAAITDTIPSSSVVGSKESLPLSKVPAQISIIREVPATQEQLSSLIPSLHIPQYGASLTSTIYLRGMGSRMDNPVLGLYIDGVPIIDKNAYDTDYLELAGATFMRGPQGTLYGRNSMGGVLSLRTAAVREGLKLSAEYGSAGQMRLMASWGRGEHSLSAGLRRHDGFFPNETTGRMCDPYAGGVLRWKFSPRPSGTTRLQHILQLALSHEGGFAYAPKGQPVSYNDEGSYSRLSLLDALTFTSVGESVKLSGSASVQLLADDMRMDQDYTPSSIFTLQQRQKSGALTAELIAKPTEHIGHWRPQTGLYFICLIKDLRAPVLFKREGIQTLMLDNANAHIPSDIGYLEIPAEELPVASDFLIATGGAAIFHESVFVWDRWTLTAGLRLDSELSSMDYDCRSSLPYRFVPTMASARTYDLTYKGTERISHLVLLPKLSVSYDASPSTMLYATLSKGHRAGGFNTQIFADILQTQMMTGLMRSLGVYLDSPPVSVGAGATAYRPEQAWGKEVGVRYRSDGITAQAAAYMLDATDQQLTVFPPGQSLGRMMANAAKSRSLGLEAEAAYSAERFRVSLSYSLCDARFVSYESGGTDYSGKRVPYVPEHTVYGGAGWRQPLGESCALRIEAALRGAAGICWNEENTLREGLHLDPGAKLSFIFPKGEFYIKGERLRAESYPVFYFKSLGREFYALSRPAAIISGIILSL